MDYSAMWQQLHTINLPTVGIIIIAIITVLLVVTIQLLLIRLLLCFPPIRHLAQRIMEILMDRE